MMIRTVTPYAVFLFLIACSSQKKEKTDLQLLNLKGEVKSIRSRTYYAIEKFGEIQKGAQTFHIKGWGDWEYDNKNIDSRVMFTKMGVFDSEINYIFDERGYFIEKNECRGENIFEKRVYKYDEKGNKIEESKYWKDGNLDLSLKCVSKYDDSKNKIETSCYDKDGILELKWRYNKYDDNGNLLEGSRYGKDGNLDLSLKCVSKYDVKENVIEENQYSKREKSISTIDLTKLNIDTSNHKQKNSSEEWRFDYQWKYKYDNKGNKIEESEYDKEGTLKNKTTYKYDDNGNIIEGKGESNSKHEYTFDKFSNWITRTGFENGNPTYIVEREIVYY